MADQPADRALPPSAPGAQGEGFPTLGELGQRRNQGKERLYRQVQDLGARVEAQQARRATTQDALHEVNAQQPGLEAALMEAEAAARQATDSTLPEKEAALRVAQQGVGEAQRRAG